MSLVDNKYYSTDVRGIGQAIYTDLCIWVKRLDEHLAELFELLRTADFLGE
jgi:hypothetical protein